MGYLLPLVFVVQYSSLFNFVLTLYSYISSPSFLLMLPHVTFSPNERLRGARRRRGDGRSVGAAAVPVRLRFVVAPSRPVQGVWPRPPAGGEPRVRLPTGSGRRPGVSHLPAAAHPAPGHTLWTYLLPGVPHQFPPGERLLPRVPLVPYAAELQEAQPAGAQAAGQAECGLPLH